jgi:general secretion pathway protein F/type IV pilus assembly protein PilC
MSQFLYVAVDKAGAKRKGIIDSSGLAEAKERIRAQGLTLLQITPKGMKGMRLSKDDLLPFTLQLSELIGAGLPLFESLQTMRQEMGSPKTGPILETLTDEIKKGIPLSQALAKFPETFDARYRALVAAGEAVGALDKVFLRLKTLIEKELKMKRELVSALTYPMILTFFSFIVISVLLLFVVPSVEDMFEGRKMEGLSAIVFGASHILRDHTFTLFFTLFSAGGALWFWRKALQPFLFTLPVVGTLLTRGALGRFSRTLGTLLEGGLPLTEALELSSKVLNHPQLEEVVVRSKEKILEGRRLSYEWRRSKFFPPLVLQLVAMGEETGGLGGAFLKVADLLDTEVEKRSAQLLALVQPLILILLGGVIGLVMVSILLPMSEMAKFQP